MQLLTHSRLATFRSCPRRHLLAYEYGLRADRPAEHIAAGSAFALAVEADANGEDVEAAINRAGIDDPYELARVAAMFTAHKQRWAGEQAEEHVAAELEFVLPLRNPSSGAATSVWQRAGKIDRIVRLPDGHLALKEYKTTSRDFAPGSDYWLRLELDMQLSFYLLAAREMGYDCRAILYDVTRRPALRPLRATPEADRKFKKDGTLYAAQRTVDETPEEFAARCTADLAENPVRSFARIEIARTDSDLEEAAAEVWLQQRALRDCQRMDRWYRNPDACISSAGWQCEFLPVCIHKDLATRTPLGFRRAVRQHEELTQR